MRSPWTNWPSHERVIDLVQRHADGYTFIELAAYSDLPVDQIRGIVGKRRLTRYRSLPESHWTPDCMTPEEWGRWDRMNRDERSARTPRPCDDCPASFALAMRARGECNGTRHGEVAA